MKSRFLVLIALTGLFGSGIAIAQDGLGKKGNSGKSSGSSSQGRSSGGSSQGRSTPPARGGSSNSSGYRTTPPTQGNGRSSGQVGGSSGGYRTSPPTQGNGRSSGQVGGSTGGYRTSPPTQGNGRSSGQVGGSTGGYRTSPPTQGNGRSSGYNTAPPSRGGIGDGRSGSGSVIGSGKGYSYTPPQDDPLGKKGGNKGGGGSGGSGGGKGGGGGTGGVRTDPGPGRGSAGSGGSGGSGGGSVDLGKVIGGRSGGGNRGGGEVPLGRPDRIGSRSGSVGYGSDHNLGRGNGKGITIGDMPVVGSNKKIEREVSRENRVRVGDSRYRSGYWNNNRGWCDDNFYYPYYGFQYYDGCNYVPSPFYYYYHLPGYISCNRITIGFLSWTSCNTRYDWNRPSYDRYQSDYDRRADFDYAVDDIERSFESGSIRQLALLIPARGRIEIDVDGRNQYSLSSDDFYDMMRDLVEGTGTTSYRIQNVYRDGDRGSIEAIHEYEDAWGRNQCVRHTFGLKLGRRGYEIVYFKSCQA